MSSISNFKINRLGNYDTDLSILNDDHLRELNELMNKNPTNMSKNLLYKI